MRFSQLNLLAEEFEIQKATKFLSKFIYKVNKTVPVTLNIEVPKKDYFRAEIFCDDIQEISDIVFTQSHLINILYNDFLNYIKRQSYPELIFKMLRSLERKDTKLVKENDKQVFRAVTAQTKETTQTLYIDFRRKHILRGEVFLADLEESFPNHGYTIEKILELLYCDFIDKLKKNDSSQIIDNILERLENE